MFIFQLQNWTFSVRLYWKLLPGLTCTLDKLKVVQRNPVNMATIGPKKIGLINKGFFTRKYMAVFARQPKKSGRKASFHCSILSFGIS